MKSNEEQALKEIVKEFARAIKSFKAKDYKTADQLFGKIINEFENSEYFSILQIHSRSKVYSDIISDLLNPKETFLENDQDYLAQGIVNLNSGNLEKAFEYFNYLEKKNYIDPLFLYLLAISHLINGDSVKSLEYLKEAINKDSSFKVTAFNEPDFEPVLESEEFLALVEIED